MEIKAVKNLNMKKTETYVATGPTAFSQEGVLVAARNTSVPRPNVIAYAGLALKRKAYRKRVAISIIAGIVVLLLVAGLVWYTTGKIFTTKNLKEGDFTLEYSTGNSLSVIDKDAFLSDVKAGNDLSAYSFAKIIYTAKPGLIGYRLEIKDTDIVMAYQGMLFGLSAGSTYVDVYSQSGGLVASVPVVVE